MNDAVKAAQDSGLEEEFQRQKRQPGITVAMKGQSKKSATKKKGGRTGRTKQTEPSEVPLRFVTN